MVSMELVLASICQLKISHGMPTPIRPEANALNLDPGISAHAVNAIPAILHHGNKSPIK